jgi:hypothetical protein
MLGGFAKNAFLAGTKKTIFRMTNTPSFSAKRTGKSSDFGRAKESGFGAPGTGSYKELAKNGAILKIRG